MMRMEIQAYGDALISHFMKAEYTFKITLKLFKMGMKARYQFKKIKNNNQYIKQLKKN